MATIDFPEIHDALGKQAKIMLYGGNGIGKTYQVTRIPNVLILDSESGTMSAPPDTLVAARPNQIDDVFASDKVRYPSFVIPVSHPIEVERIARVFERRQNRSRFRAVVIDSMTYLYDVIICGDVRKNFAGNAVEVIMSEDGKDVLRALSGTGHQYAQTRTVEVMELFRDVGCHFVWTFHEGMRTENGTDVIQPLLGGNKLLPKLKGLADFGLRIEWQRRKVESGETRSDRVLRCHPSATVWAKNRGPHGDKLREIEPCDLNRIIHLIETGELSKVGELPKIGKVVDTAHEVVEVPVQKVTEAVSVVSMVSAANVASAGVPEASLLTGGEG